MISGFKVLSISHKLASIKIREKFAMTSAECSNLLPCLKDSLGLKEALVVSTCNRTEIYYNDSEVNIDKVYKFLCAYRTISDSSKLLKYFVTLEGNEAINHLYNVAIGLDSQVLGDIQIFGQIKQAYQVSSDNGMAGPLLHRLLHSIFHVHKRVSQETKFKTGAASISYNAVKLITTNTLIPKDVKILISGVGSIGSATAKNLVNCGYTNVTLTNRTDSKANEIASELGLEVLAFEAHKTKLEEFDVLFSCVGVSVPMYNTKNLESAGLTVAIDLSSPRSIIKNGSEDRIRLFDIDAVANMRDDTLSLRAAEVPKVKEIIHTGLSEFVDWSDEMVATGSIKTFKNALEEIQKDCIKANLKRMSSKELEMVEIVTSQFINKIIQKPIIKLKQECKRDSAGQLSDVLVQLFDLQKESLKES